MAIVQPVLDDGGLAGNTSRANAHRPSCNVYLPYDVRKNT